MPVDKCSGKKCAKLRDDVFCSTCTRDAIVCPDCFVNVRINNHCYSCGSTEVVGKCTDCTKVVSGGKRFEHMGGIYYFCKECRTSEPSLPRASPCPVCKNKTVLSTNRWKMIIGIGPKHSSEMCFYFKCNFFKEAPTYDPCISP